MTKTISSLLTGAVLTAAMFPIASIAVCLGGQGTPDNINYQFRKEQAARQGPEMLSKIINALDTVLISQGTDPAFSNAIQFAIDRQYDQTKMNIVLENNEPLTNAADFRARWKFLAGQYVYRKRNITDWVVTNYVEDGPDCLREISMYGVGMSFGVLKPGSTIIGSHTSRAWADFDRFTVTFKERATGDWRIKDVVQITEGSFALPDPATTLQGLYPGRSPLTSGAKAVLDLSAEGAGLSK
jgi:hypothetical protein